MADEFGGVPVGNTDEFGGVAVEQPKTSLDWSKLTGNLKESAANFANALAGGPTSQRPDTKPSGRFSQAHPDVADSHPMIAAAADSLEDLVHNVTHPSEFFEKDPVGAANTYGQLAAGGLGAVKSIPGVAGAAETAANAVKAAASAGGKDIAVGTAKMAGGVALPMAIAHLPGGPAIETAAEIAGVPAGIKLAKGGAQQFAQGAKAAFQAGRDALTNKLQAAVDARLKDAFDPENAPKTDVQLAAPINPEPGVAGAQPMQVSPATIPGRPPRGPIPVAPGQQIMAPGNSGLSAVPVEQTGPTVIPASPEVPSAVYEAKARAEKATKLAEFLNQGGITAQEAKGMTGDHWQLAAKGAGVNAPSLVSQGQAVFELRKLEAASHSPELMKRLQSTGSMSLAEQLAQEMTK